MAHPMNLSPAVTIKSRVLLGLDLGQAQDPSALIGLARVVERVPEEPAEQERRELAGLPEPWKPPRYEARLAQRFALQTEYAQVGARVKTVASHDVMRGNCTLVVDHTGVGRAVVESLRRTMKGVAPLVPITIVAGNTVSYAPDDGSWHVPKRELVGVLQILLQEKRLLIAEDLPDRDALLREMETLRVKITVAGHDTYEAWREQDHDDLVLAAALACWWGEQRMPRTPGTAQSTAYDREMVEVLDRLAGDR